MKFSMKQDVLESALGIVGQSVKGKSTLPVLGNVYVSVNGDNELTLFTTNLEISTVCHVHVELVQEVGDTTIPFALLSQVVKGIDKGNVITFDLNQVSQKMKLSAGGMASNINCIAGYEFPALPNIDPDMALEISTNGKSFGKAVESVAYAASRNESRPVLSGVVIELKDDERLTLAATDGFRLATTKVGAVVTNRSESEYVVIPHAAMILVARLASSSAENISISIPKSGNQVVFSVALNDGKVRSVQVATQLLDGRYPDYRAIIPKQDSVFVELPTDQIDSAIRMGLVFSKDENSIIKMDVNGARMTVSANSETGNNKSDLPATTQGDSLTIAVNGRYILETLKTGNGLVKLGMTQPARPIRVTFDDQPDALHVLMPMHLPPSEVAAK